MIRMLLVLTLLAPGPDSADGHMGRLFFTPAERTRLDALRRESQTLPGVVTAAVAGAAPDSALALHGFVKRADGRGTVWVNHRPLPEASTQDGLGIGRLDRKDGRVRLRLVGAGKDFSLKAGQAGDPSTGRVVEFTSGRDLP